MYICARRDSGKRYCSWNMIYNFIGCSDVGLVVVLIQIIMLLVPFHMLLTALIQILDYHRSFIGRADVA